MEKNHTKMLVFVKCHAIIDNFISLVYYFVFIITLSVDNLCLNECHTQQQCKPSGCYQKNTV